ncbi:dTDP-4-dehydrorhamnose 3,5-epimerase [Gordonia amarae]|uniref:dTDP-6-deoxy-D-xylo-4-hexulose 3,5-epimerase n=2 Tax=Gordonia amarae TaxID=36821 RepID=G7GIQ0_9ACTN|nr:dTDP-4-dehydrorhamnose 3,5-epimerase family protein [Gordonia amarae]MCS3880899.1 dTDP-4-dehydrorhamnose 3,5-epimerase [Gordonia amarae]QHN19156.1 dTDP-4-dehydrorhamnose 3,5-epimerase [Gordonia amarae]QHN23632.1 dTDP-4-dehydrorhamnose 3,5-epimerase [Gordonia amarae]QHN32542.1 dTDP-4-dehydrorhamnose 3,5-epimerase [Gordonia amarae]QHN41291.1 dTDP-4-dehydrorhamnose 3,5-epimerase [Gordonia amarae]
MRVRPLAIAGAWEITPVLHGDSRGLFTEAFKADLLSEMIGHRFDLAQVNLSVSAAGVLRGIHFADVPPGQAKYVTCPSGAILDVIVDIRVGSPTFGQYDTVLLDDVDRRAVYLSEGLGHGFCALADGSTVTYLCSTGYDPSAEHGINPLDPALGIDWPTTARDGTPLTYSLSDKDTAAPSLADAAASGLLPDHDDVAAYLRSLAGTP